MKLVSIHPLQALALPGIRASATMTMKLEEWSAKGWDIHVRGPAVLFVAPPEFQLRDGNGKEIGPAGKDRRVYEVPRSLLNLGWDMAPGDKLEDVSKYSPPLRPPVTASVPSDAVVEQPPVPTPTAPTPPSQPDVDPEEDEIPPAYRGKKKL